MRFYLMRTWNRWRNSRRRCYIMIVHYGPVCLKTMRIRCSWDNPIGRLIYLLYCKQFSGRGRWLEEEYGSNDVDTRPARHAGNKTTMLRMSRQLHYPKGIETGTRIETDETPLTRWAERACVRMLLQLLLLSLALGAHWAVIYSTEDIISGCRDASSSCRLYDVITIATGVINSIS